MNDKMDWYTTWLVAKRFYTNQKTFIFFKHTF
jgi:hypothetical protein